MTLTGYIILISNPLLYMTYSRLEYKTKSFQLFAYQQPLEFISHSIFTFHYHHRIDRKRSTIYRPAISCLCHALTYTKSFEHDEIVKLVNHILCWILYSILAHPIRKFFRYKNTRQNNQYCQTSPYSTKQSKYKTTNIIWYNSC